MCKNFHSFLQKGLLQKKKKGTKSYYDASQNKIYANNPIIVVVQYIFLFFMLKNITVLHFGRVPVSKWNCPTAPISGFGGILATILDIELPVGVSLRQLAFSDSAGSK